MIHTSLVTKISLCSTCFWLFNGWHPYAITGDRRKEEQTSRKLQQVSICSSLHPVSFMLLWLSTNSSVVKSHLARVQLSRMRVGNSESIQVHHFGLLCTDYNLEIITELLQLVSLAIKKIVLFCLSRLRSALFFFWNSALSIMGNGAGNCLFIFAQYFVNGKYFWNLLSTRLLILSSGKGTLTFVLHSLPIAERSRSSCSSSVLIRQLDAFTASSDWRYWFKDSIYGELWMCLAELLYFNAQWELCLYGIVPCLSCSFPIF